VIVRLLFNVHKLILDYNEVKAMHALPPDLDNRLFQGTLQSSMTGVSSAKVFRRVWRELTGINTHVGWS